jgi:heat shock protein beta
MVMVALGGRWGRSDTEEAEATTSKINVEIDYSEATMAEVVEPSEVRTESDTWRD